MSFRSIVRCNNPKCITNNEPMDTIFHVVDKEHGILKCHYCDKEQEMEKVELGIECKLLGKQVYK